MSVYFVFRFGRKVSANSLSEAREKVEPILDMCDHLCKYSPFRFCSRYSTFKEKGVLYSFFFYAKSGELGILKEAASIFIVMNAVGCELHDTFIADEAELPGSSIF